MASRGQRRSWPSCRPKSGRPLAESGGTRWPLVWSSRPQSARFLTPCQWCVRLRSPAGPADPIGGGPGRSVRAHGGGAWRSDSGVGQIRGGGLTMVLGCLQSAPESCCVPVAAWPWWSASGGGRIRGGGVAGRQWCVGQQSPAAVCAGPGQRHRPGGGCTAGVQSRCWCWPWCRSRC
jgi:hypothetical protein